MVDVFRQKSLGFGMVTLSLLILCSSIGNYASGSPAVSRHLDENNIIPEVLNLQERELKYGFSFKPFPRMAIEAAQHDLRGVAVTLQFLEDAIAPIMKAKGRPRTSRQVQQSFTASPICQIPGLTGNRAQIGSHILKYIIKATDSLNASTTTQELEAFIPVLECLVVEFKEVTGRKQQEKETISQEDDDDLQKLIDETKDHITTTMEELKKRQDDIQNDMLQKFGIHPRVRRDSGPVTVAAESQTTESLNYDNLTLNEIEALLTRESSDLHSVLLEISNLTKELNIARDATTFSKDVIAELENLIALLLSSEANNDIGLIKLTHGPYCNGLMKNGTILEVFWEMLPDTIDHTIAIANARSQEALEKAIENASCRVSALSTIVQISSTKMNASDISDVSGALNISRVEVEESRDRLQESFLETEDKLKVLTLRKEELQSHLAKLKEVHKRLVGQHRNLQDGGMGHGSMSVVVEQIVNSPAGD